MFEWLMEWLKFIPCFDNMTYMYRSKIVILSTVPSVQTSCRSMGLQQYDETAVAEVVVVVYFRENYTIQIKHT